MVETLGTLAGRLFGSSQVPLTQRALTRLIWRAGLTGTISEVTEFDSIVEKKKKKTDRLGLDDLFQLHKCIFLTWNIKYMKWNLADIKS